MWHTHHRAALAKCTWLWERVLADRPSLPLVPPQALPRDREECDYGREIHIKCRLMHILQP